METADIEVLLHESSYPCISITLPSESVTDLKATVRETEELLRMIDIPDETRTRIFSALEGMEIRSLNNGSAGLGIFVSPRVTGLVPFPFAVKKRICVDQRFDTDYLLQLLDVERVADLV